MIKLIAEILKITMGPIGFMFGACEPAAKLLSKMFWIGAFLGFNPDNETIENLDKKLEEKYEKCRENETFRKVDDGLCNAFEFVARLFIDFFMISCTGGLWIFWMIIRHYRNKKKNNKNKAQ